MKAHRDFEMLVARIEGALGPVGARVTSPEHFIDKVTGEEREVDATIRYTIGSVPVLITVECRDRVRAEDVTWIEQLATKQQHVGATHTVAVSSTGFSRPALKAAKAHGISTRRIDAISDAEILAWVETIEVDEIDTACALGRLALVYDGAHPGAHLDAPSEQSWNSQAWDAPIFLDSKEGRTHSLSDLISRAVRERGRPLNRPTESVAFTIPPKASVTMSEDPLSVIARDAPINGGPVEKTYWIEFIDENMEVRTNQGTLKLRKVGFEITMSSTRRRLPVDRVVSYSGEEGVIAHIAEREISFGRKGEKLVLTQHRPVARHPDAEYHPAPKKAPTRKRKRGDPK
jgi:hypothetical protein